MTERERTGILLVCMGNICRSPTAHGVLRARAAAAGLAATLRIDSAGTHGYHIGQRPDRRALAAAAERGYDLSDLRAREVVADDLRRFRYVLAMDRENLQSLQGLAERSGGATARIRLFMDFSAEDGGVEVPDPYYGGVNGFDHVLDLVERGAEGLIDHLRRGEGAAGRG